jgi:hypothetical protein
MAGLIMFDKAAEWEAAIAAKKRRSLRVSQFEERYRIAPDDGACVYCGSLEQTLLDHVPPLAVAWAVSPEWKLWKYRACGWCNEALGPHPDSCLLNRQGVLLEVTQKRASIAYDALWADELGKAVAKVDALFASLARARSACQCFACLNSRDALQAAQDAGELGGVV